MNKASHLVKSLQVLSNSIDIQSIEPKGYFGRRCIIKSGNVTIDSNELDIEFNVPFDDNIEANEAEILIYNLSKNTISQLKYNTPITITAGYKSDTGIIFSGFISKVTTKFDGVDKKTTIFALDSIDLKEQKIESIAYKENTKASYILNDLIKRVKLPLAIFKIKRDWTYKEAVNVDGNLMENIKKYAEVCGVSAYISKSKIYVQHLKNGQNINFTVSTDTGLISSPEEFEKEITAEDYTDSIKGYKIKMLLQHRMNTAAIIKLSSQEFSGQFRVISGQHIFNNSEAITEIEVF